MFKIFGRHGSPRKIVAAFGILTAGLLIAIPATAASAQSQFAQGQHNGNHDGDHDGNGNGNGGSDGDGELSWDNDPAVEARVDAILAQMTLQQKVDLATGNLNNSYGFYNAPIPELGIPAQTMADGPVGVRVANGANDGKSTQLPSGSSLAATWDTDLAHTYGALIGQEAFRLGNNMSLAPSADIARTPLWGRAFEGFGEDPLLSGTFNGDYITGVQSNVGVGATIKHFNAYNQETDRFNVNVVVGERALHEIYNRVFEIGVGDGRPAAAMCSFNKINSVYACANSLMTSMLKGTDDLRGFIMSDYNATPDTNNAANAGLDQEQPGDQGPDSANFGERLIAAVIANQVPLSRVDDMARRILRGMVGLGLIDNPVVIQPLETEADAAVAREVAADGMVLLKNEPAVLPLSGANAESIAVLGPDADDISAQGGGSSTISKPTSSVDPLTGIITRAGDGATVTYNQGVDGISEGSLLPGPAPIPSSVLTPVGGGATDHGLSAQYWGNTTFSGDPHLVQVDPNVNTDFGFQNYPGFNVASPKIPTVRGDFALLGDLSVKWDGTFTAPATAEYTLGLTARGDALLTIDGQEFVTHSGELSSVGKKVTLTAGEPHAVSITYSAPALNQYTGGQVRMFWEHPEDVLSPDMQAAVDAAKVASSAVIVVRDYETEGVDRPSLELPNEQPQLIRQVAKVNPNTVVVIETGAPALMSTWDANVAGVIQAWYPGQEQGTAIADVLFGDVNPNGKLPVTAPLEESQALPTPSGTVDYTEGIYVGYRGYEHNNITPQYPFGYGLSYTTFEYSDLSTRVRNGTKVSATFTVTNTGDVTGDAVPQVYAGTLPTDVPTPPVQLAGWDKITLEPGQSQQVTVPLDKQSLSYWDSYANQWIMPSGRVNISVGTSSTDLVLTDSARIRSDDQEGGGAIESGVNYSIVNQFTSKCVDALDHGTANGTPIQMFDCPAPGLNQQWQFTPTKRGYFTITGVEASPKVLDVAGGPTATQDGAKLQLWTPSGGTNQQFKPVRIGDGDYQFVVRSSGKCLGVTGGSLDNGALVEQQTCQDGNAAQSFHLDVIPASQ